MDPSLITAICLISTSIFLQRYRSYYRYTNSSLELPVYQVWDYTQKCSWCLCSNTVVFTYELQQIVVCNLIICLEMYKISFHFEQSLQKKMIYCVCLLLMFRLLRVHLTRRYLMSCAGQWLLRRTSSLVFSRECVHKVTASSSSVCLICSLRTVILLSSSNLRFVL